MVETHLFSVAQDYSAVQSSLANGRQQQSMARLSIAQAPVYKQRRCHKAPSTITNRAEHAQPFLKHHVHLQSPSVRSSSSNNNNNLPRIKENTAPKKVNQLAVLNLNFDEYYRGKHKKLKACNSNEETGERAHSALHQTRSWNFPTQAEASVDEHTVAVHRDAHHDNAVPEPAHSSSNNSQSNTQRTATTVDQNVQTESSVLDDDDTEISISSSSDWSFASSDELVKWDCTSDVINAGDKPTTNDQQTNSLESDTRPQLQSIHKQCTDETAIAGDKRQVATTLLNHAHTSNAPPTAQSSQQNASKHTSVAHQQTSSTAAADNVDEPSCLHDDSTAANSESSLLLRPEFVGMKPTFV